MALVRKLGRVAYAPTLELQLQLAAKYKNISRGAVSRESLAVPPNVSVAYKVGEILLVEHEPPVYTFGLRQKDYKLHAERLRDLGAEVHKVVNVPCFPLAVLF